MTTTITWSAAHADAKPGEWIVENEETVFVGEWAAAFAPLSTIERCIDEWFTPERWQRHFGDREELTEIVVTVDLPHTISGTYGVTLERPVRASARKR